MTKTYAITEDNAQILLSCIGEISYGSLQQKSQARETAIAILKSLPLITGEPVASVKSFTSGSYHRNYQLDWYKDVPVSAKLYTSPQPLQPITADMVTDAMQREFMKVPYDTARKKVFLAAVNAWIKHCI